MSAVLPGSGEIYNHHLNRGVALITTDCILLLSTYRFNSEIVYFDKSYKQFAHAKANIPLNSSKEYYKLIHNYYNSDIYNAEIELYFRNLGLYRYNDPNYYNEQILFYQLPEDKSFRWKSESDWNAYKSIRRHKQAQIINRRLAIGALIANRIISGLDVIFLSKKQNKSNLPQFDLAPGFDGEGIKFSCSVEF